MHSLWKQCSHFNWRSVSPTAYSSWHIEHWDWLMICSLLICIVGIKAISWSFRGSMVYTLHFWRGRTVGSGGVKSTGVHLVRGAAFREARRLGMMMIDMSKVCTMVFCCKKLMIPKQCLVNGCSVARSWWSTVGLTQRISTSVMNYRSKSDLKDTVCTKASLCPLIGYYPVSIECYLCRSDARSWGSTVGLTQRISTSVMNYWSKSDTVRTIASLCLPLIG